MNTQAPEAELALSLKRNNREWSAARIAREIKDDTGKVVTKDAVQKWLRRSGEFNVAPKQNPLPPYIDIKRDSALVIGDIHSYTADWDAIEQALNAGVARGIETVLVNGDVYCQDQYSKYDAFFPHASFSEEQKSVKHFFSLALSRFKEVVWVTGNHDERIGKQVYGEIDISNLADTVVRPEDRGRVVTTPYNYMFITVGGERWFISHLYKYGKPLAVANDAAYHYQCNVIHNHQHIVARGTTKNGMFKIIDNGCMCRQDLTPYALLRGSVMKPFEQSWVILDGEEVVLEQPTRGRKSKNTKAPKSR